jgi:mRNA interferase MazF
MKKGDIVLIPFPFTDLSGSKIRPVLILISSLFDVTVCFITAQLKFRDRLDLMVTPSSWTRPKRSSLIRVTKIATIDRGLVIGRLGTLSPPEISAVNSQLSEALDL